MNQRQPSREELLWYLRRVTTAMVIPEQAKVNGAIETPDDLEVQGRCDGRIEIGGALLVAASATCRAAVRARSARIFGEVIGDVLCSDSIKIGAGARVVGDLRAPDVSVDSTAEVDGRVDLLPPDPEALPLRQAPVTVRGPAPRRPSAPPARTPHPSR